jgi:hypothetical protein
MGVSVRVDGVMVVAALAVVAAGVVWYNRRAIIGAVDITSDQNIAYQTANKLTQAATGDSGQTFGGWVYDTRAYNPLAWINEGIMKVLGD